MNLDLVYICIHGASEPGVPRDFDTCHRRFVATYLRHKPTIQHKIVIVNYNGERTPETDRIFEPLNAEHIYYHGNGLDIGAYQSAAKALDSDFTVFCNSQVHFHHDGWLERLVAAFKKHGEGIYGPMGSYERMPHLRTCCVAMPPKLMRKYPFFVNSRPDACRAESGDWNLTRWFADQRKRTLMVTWDGELEVQDWRKPDNIFRRGDQSNCLVWDRHTKVYAEEATPQYRRELQNSAQGVHGVHSFDVLCGVKGVPDRKSVTIVAFTSIAPKSHAEAIKRTASCIPFECRKLLMSPVELPNFDGEQMRLPEPWAKNGTWTMQAMAAFTLAGLHRYISTDVAIIVHWDGYGINPGRWSDRFFEWDYIGAPWPVHLTHVKNKANGRVGNGGFSLRSKRWLQVASTLPKYQPEKFSEDVFTAQINMNHFTRAKCRFAPVPVAMRWSFEHVIGEYPYWNLADSFGFHGLTKEFQRAHLRLDPNS